MIIIDKVKKPYMEHRFLTAAAALVLFPAAMGWAGDGVFHAPAAFGLNGPVKEVMNSSADNEELPVSDPDNLHFKANGEMENPSCRYDDAGYLVSYTMTRDDSFAGMIHIEYNAERMCVRTIADVTAPIKMTITDTYEYRDRKVVANKTHTDLRDPALAAVMPEGIPEMTMTYSNVEYDSHSNWIKRDVKISLAKPKFSRAPAANDLNFTQSRIITYY